MSQVSKTLLDIFEMVNRGKGRAFATADGKMKFEFVKNPSVNWVSLSRIELTYTDPSSYKNINQFFPPTIAALGGKTVSETYVARITPKKSCAPIVPARIYFVCSGKVISLVTTELNKARVKLNHITKIAATSHNMIIESINEAVSHDPHYIGPDRHVQNPSEGYNKQWGGWLDIKVCENAVIHYQTTQKYADLKAASFVARPDQLPPTGYFCPEGKCHECSCKGTGLGDDACGDLCCSSTDGGPMSPATIPGLNEPCWGKHKCAAGTTWDTMSDTSNWSECATECATETMTAMAFNYPFGKSSKNKYIELTPTSVGSPFQTEMTACAWVKVVQPDALGHGRIVSQARVAGGSGTGWNIYVEKVSDNNVAFNFAGITNKGTFRLGLTPVSGLPVGSWFHACGTYSQSKRKARIYLDGKIASEVDLLEGTSLLGQSTNKITIGREWGSNTVTREGGRRLAGTHLAGVTLWNRALGPVEIKAIDEAGIFASIGGDPVLSVKGVVAETGLPSVSGSSKAIMRILELYDSASSGGNVISKMEFAHTTAVCFIELEEEIEEHVEDEEGMEELEPEEIIALLQEKEGMQLATDKLLDWMGGFKDLYLTEVSVTVTLVNREASLMIQGKFGKPKECSGPFSCILMGLSVLPEISLTMTIDDKDFSAELALPAPGVEIVPNKLWMADEEGNGPGPMYTFSVSNMQPSLSVGLNLGMTFCVEGCTSGFEWPPKNPDGKRRPADQPDLNVGLPRDITLQGTLSKTVSLTRAPTPSIKGSLALIGSWYNVNALNLLHIANAQLSLGILFPFAGPLPVPVSFAIGGKESCF